MINPAFAQASKQFDANRPSAVILLHYTCKLFFSKFFASKEPEFPKIYLRLPKIAEDFATTFEDSRSWRLQKNLNFCVAYTKCIATLWRHLIYLFVHESQAPVTRCATLADCRLADLQTCRLADLQTCRLADLQTCRLADLQTCRLADLQTCRLADL